MTWLEYAERAGRVAAGLRSVGVAAGDRVALLMSNRPEFHVADIATQLVGATPLSLYNSSPPDQLRYLLAHSGATAVAVEDGPFLERVLSVRADIPSLQHVFAVGEGEEQRGTRPFAELEGEGTLDVTLETSSVGPDDIATVIYTSGTTGPPKGVLLSHANLRYAVEIYCRVLGRSLQGLRQLSYLPMAHIGERLATHYFHVVNGSVVTTCPDLAALPEFMVEVRPQWWFCAPRLWERLQAGIEATLIGDAAQRERFDAARLVGMRVFEHTNAGEPAPAALAAEWARLHERDIRPVLARLGLDDVQIAITGSAPLPRSTLEFFLSCGVPLSDCYGQSETSGFVSWSATGIVPGTSGRPFPGVEVEVASDGEILARGPNVFVGYLGDPERTAEALDVDGWLHTGDVGTVDAEGNLTVTGRKSEMLVPSSGHKVSPVAIEAALKEHPLVREACALGDGRPFVAALLVLDPELAPAWAAERDVATGDLALLAANPAVRAELEEHVATGNARFARAEQVRAFAIVGDVWMPDSDVLTPTSKLKRKNVAERYADEIDALYA